MLPRLFNQRMPRAERNRRCPNTGASRDYRKRSGKAASEGREPRRQSQDRPTNIQSASLPPPIA